MPVEYRIDVEAGVIHRSLIGEVTTDELLADFSRALEDPDYRPGMNSLTDLREVKPYAHRDDVLRVARFLLEHHERIDSFRAAVVVSSDSIYGMVRMLQQELKDTDIEIQVFRDFDAARGWLLNPAERSSATSDAR
jgi:hypothetical protein